jgi:hypothetical protein
VRLGIASVLTRWVATSRSHQRRGLLRVGYTIRAGKLFLRITYRGHRGIMAAGRRSVRGHYPGRAVAAV